MAGDETLCKHLEGGDLEAAAAEPAHVFDWRDGLITAIVRCPECSAAAVLEMLDWSADGRTRIYALSALGPDPLATFARNTRSGSCDLGRRQRELEALFACAAPPRGIVAIRASDGSVLARGPFPAHTPPPSGPWDERLPAPGDARWFDALRLAKHDG